MKLKKKLDFKKGPNAKIKIKRMRTKFEIRI